MSQFPSKRILEKIRQRKTTWVYHESKESVIRYLEIYSEKVDTSETLDELRSKLAKVVKNGKHLDILGEEATERLEERRERQQQHDDAEEVVVPVLVQKKFTMCDSGKLTFTLGKDDWEMYTERLEMFFLANDIKEEKKVPVLLTKVDADTYSLLKDLCTPDLPKSKTYDQLVEILLTHFKPTPSISMERCKFQQARQEEDETVTEFIARLKKLSKQCKYTDLKTALRDQLVCGLSDYETKVELFREKVLTYEKVVQIAESRETAKSKAVEVQAMVSGESSKPNVHYVNNQPRASRGKFNPKYKRQNNDYNSSNKCATKAITTGKHQFGKQTRNTPSAPSAPKPSTSRNTDHYTEMKHCFCCGKVGHHAKDCRFKHMSCAYCKTKGHLIAACWKLKYKNTQGRIGYVEIEEVTEENTSVTDKEVEPFFCISQNRANVGPMKAKVRVCEKEINFEIDSGAFISAISEKCCQENFSDWPVTSISENFRNYDGSNIVPRGLLRDIPVEFNGKKEILELYIIGENGPPIMGRSWLNSFGLWPLKYSSTKVIHSVKNERNQTIADLKAEFAEVFSEGQGTLKGEKLKLYVKDNIKPTACKPATVALALKPKIEKELDRLVELKNLIPVETSEWATQVVPILKEDGEVRVCGNFKRTLNPYLIIDKHPMPLIDQIFASLQGGIQFSKIDLKYAYQQIEVEEESQKYLTIITHKGLFKYTRLPYGVASGPGSFQRIIEQKLKGIPGIAVFIDDIIVTGPTEEAHMQSLKMLLARLKECGLKANSKKCEFFKDSITYLGFVIDKKGLHKDPEKMRAIIEAPEPKDAKILTAWLGLVTYYGRFIKDRAEIVRPLYDALEKETWEWTEKCQEAFQNTKDALMSAEVLVHFDPKLPVLLNCDASEYGLSAVLAHEFPDDSEIPIAFASQTIPKNERIRAQVDKEAAAIIFGVKKFYDYLYGRKFELRTDHKSLLRIFGPYDDIPKVAANRLQRWAQFLAAFTYDIRYVKSSDNGNADALSRLPNSDTKDAEEIFSHDYTYLKYVDKCHLSNVNAKTVAVETAKDPVLKKVLLYIVSEWPTDKEKLSEEERKYANRKSELYVEKGCIMMGIRVVIPTVLRERILDEVHESHLGIIKMKAVARSFFWWPGVDYEIEKHAKTCKICLSLNVDPAKMPLTPWLWPEKPWTRIHADFLGPLFGKMFLVILDSHSKWPEIVDMGSCTVAEKLIAVFRTIFARFGLPHHLVTDNGTQFKSEEFATFMISNGVKQSFSPPYHPATNGAAENFVKTFKAHIKKMVKDGHKVNYAIDKFLFDYRSIPHATTGSSPAKLMLGREIRVKLDLLRPKQTIEIVQEKQNAQKSNVVGSRNVTIHEGEKVMVKDYRKGKDKWEQAIIVKCLSPRTYSVKVGDEIWKRHIDQIRKIIGEIIQANDQPDKKDEVKPKLLRRSPRLNR